MDNLRRIGLWIGTNGLRPLVIVPVITIGVVLAALGDAGAGVSFVAAALIVLAAHRSIVRWTGQSGRPPQG